MDKMMKRMEKKVAKKMMDPAERKRRGKEIHTKQMARHQAKVRAKEIIEKSDATDFNPDIASRFSGSGATVRTGSTAEATARVEVKIRYGLMTNEEIKEQRKELERNANTAAAAAVAEKLAVEEAARKRAAEEKADTDRAAKKVKKQKKKAKKDRANKLSFGDEEEEEY